MQAVTLRSSLPRYNVRRLFLETVKVQSRRIIASSCASRLGRLILPIVIYRLPNLLLLAVFKLAKGARLNVFSFLGFLALAYITAVDVHIVFSGGTIQVILASIGRICGDREHMHAGLPTFLVELGSIWNLTFRLSSGR